MMPNTMNPRRSNATRRRVTLRDSNALPRQVTLRDGELVDWNRLTHHASPRDATQWCALLRNATQRHAMSTNVTPHHRMPRNVA